MVTNKSQTLRKMEEKMAVMRGKRDQSISWFSQINIWEQVCFHCA